MSEMVFGFVIGAFFGYIVTMIAYQDRVVKSFKHGMIRATRSYVNAFTENNNSRFIVETLRELLVGMEDGSLWK